MEMIKALQTAFQNVDFPPINGKTFITRLGEIQDDNSLNEFYKEWKKFFKKQTLILHPDKGGDQKKFQDFYENAGRINSFFDQYTQAKDDDGREFKKESGKMLEFIKIAQSLQSQGSTAGQGPQNSYSEFSQRRGQNQSFYTNSSEELFAEFLRSIRRQQEQQKTHKSKEDSKRDIKAEPSNKKLNEGYKNQSSNHKTFNPRCFTAVSFGSFIVIIDYNNSKFNEKNNFDLPSSKISNRNTVNTKYDSYLSNKFNNTEKNLHSR